MENTQTCLTCGEQVFNGSEGMMEHLTVCEGDELWKKRCKALLAQYSILASYPSLEDIHHSLADGMMRLPIQLSPSLDHLQKGFDEGKEDEMPEVNQSIYENWIAASRRLFEQIYEKSCTTQEEADFANAFLAYANEVCRIGDNPHTKEE